MAFDDLMTALSDAVMTIDPPLKPGTYDVGLTKVRAIEDGAMTVLCTIQDPPFAVRWTTRLSVEVPEDPEQRKRFLDAALDGLPPMRWLIGEDGQIEGISSPE